ncbi:MAG: hypothetical protein HYT37_03105 [Candidatus Sungbacteria bacterium]|nr:hypothetical protein [Candidatus Sungbacteria bacterium]
MSKTHRFFICFLCSVAFVLNGCSGTNYRGEGAVLGGLIGAGAGLAACRGNPICAGAAGAGGAVLGAGLGMMFDKKEGKYEQQLSLRAKELKLYEECVRLVEYQPSELALQRYEVYGGHPSQYLPPQQLAKIGKCRQMFSQLFSPSLEEEQEEETRQYQQHYEEESEYEEE